jgi:selenocysteine lyase/cysteine desulfurase
MVIQGMAEKGDHVVTTNLEHNSVLRPLYHLKHAGTIDVTYIPFDGKGYNTFVAKSDDLVHWKKMRLAMGFGPKGEFDNGGCVLGAYSA